jgi:DNA-binding transcriptional regulator WhiA
MNLSASQISNACFKYRIIFSERARKEAMRKAAHKGHKIASEKYKWTEWTNERLLALKKLKEDGLSNKEISSRLSVPKSSVENACHINRILLSPEKLKEKQAEAGRKGSLKLIPIYKERGQLHSFDSNLGYIIGVLYGDGSMSDRKNHGSVQLKTTNKSFAMAFFRALVNYGANAKYHVRRYNKIFKKEGRVYNNIIYYEIFYNSIYFVKNIVEKFGLTTTKEWKIDVDYVTSLGKDFYRALIKGLFDSEGSFSVAKKTSLEFSSTNEKGAQSLHLLLSNLGFDFRLNKVKRDGFYEYKIRTGKNSNIIKFYEDIGFSIDYKKEKLEKFVKERKLI